MDKEIKMMKRSDGEILMDLVSRVAILETQNSILLKRITELEREQRYEIFPRIDEMNEKLNKGD